MNRTARCIILGCLLWPGSALALDPALDASQYAHTAWRNRDGFSRDRITSIAQTPDGYLWLGTEFGLLRFDGVRNVPWQPPAGQALPSGHVRSLLAARDGTLWIAAPDGLASWKSGKLTSYPELAGWIVNALLEDREGTVWAGMHSLSGTGRLCAIRAGNVQCHGEDGSLGRSVLSLYEDSKGQLWAGGADALWRWTPGPPKLYSLLDPIDTLQTLTEGDNGALLIATRGGIRRIVDGKVEAFPLPAAGIQVQPSRMFRDREGGLWIGTRDQGLLHVHQGRMDVFMRSDGLSGDSVSRFFEDREGNIWVATPEGLDRFREFAAPTVSVGQGLSNASVGSVLAAKDGSVWLTTSAGLNRWSNGQMTVYRERRERSARGASLNPRQSPAVRQIFDSGLPDRMASLFQDARGRIWIGTHGRLGYLENGRFVSIDGVPGGYVDSIAEDRRGDLWIAHRDRGLLRWSPGHEVQRNPWAGLGRSDPAFRLAADPVRGGLWLGYFAGGVAHFVDGRIEASYGAADGLGKGHVNHVHVDRDGALWAATDGGLSRLKNGRLATLTSQSGLPCDTAHWMIEDAAGSVWLYMACGIARIARSELDAWAAAADQGKDAKRTIRATFFDSSDGVGSTATRGTFSPQAARSTDGKLWFPALNGVTVIDPRRLPHNALPPPVHIEQIVADRKAYELAFAGASALTLPPLVRDLQIDYTATSLVAPEKTRFRYKLEGQDREWQDAGTRRQAFYNDLPPGNYRFRVSASNNSGVWNEAGASVEFSVAAAYYQTVWFRLLIVATLAGTAWVVYRTRVRTLTAHLAEVRQENRERVRAEEALRQSEERFALAVAGSNEGIFDWDLIEDRVYLARRTQELVGLAPGEPWRARKEWQRLLSFHPDDVSHQHNRLKAHIAGETEAYDVELRLIVAGEARWFRQRGTALRDPSGKAYRMVGSVGDITERKAAQEELLRLERRLRQAQRFEAMGTLAGGIAHDFNNILGAVLGYGESAMRGTERGSRLRRDLDSIVAAGERGRALVDRILEFSRGGANERIPVHVEKVVREVIDLLQGRLPAGVTVDARLNAGLAATLGDPTQVHQIVMNLGTNAIQAMPAGGTLSVSVDVARFDAECPTTIGTVGAGEWLVLKVSDTGGGIPPEIVERIFDPFFTTKETGVGTGLGLSLVLRIVSEADGAIDVASTPGAGSTFTVYLPRTGDAAETREDEESDMPRGDGQRVLVVDDEELLLNLAARTLEDLGYAPIAFTSSTAALDAFRADPQGFDAAITDERMPGIAGVELIRHIRDIHRSIPILLVSGYVGGTVASRAYDVGADEVLKKPLSAQDLATSLARVLRLH